jgi:uncharacterized membrane protein YesL
MNAGMRDVVVTLGGVLIACYIYTNACDLACISIIHNCFQCALLFNIVHSTTNMFATYILICNVAQLRQSLWVKTFYQRNLVGSIWSIIICILNYNLALTSVMQNAF